MSLLALVAATGCDRPSVRGKRVGEWVIALHASDPRTRLTAAHVLADARGAGRLAIKPLVTALGDPADAVREQAAYALGAIGRDATRFLAPRLDDPKLTPGEARWVARALAAIARTDPAARERLLAASRASTPAVRVAAVRALGHTRDPAVAERLIELLDGEDALLRRDAALALAHMGVAGRAAIAVLVQHLRVDDRELVTACLTALGAVGRSVEVAAPEAAAVRNGLAAAFPSADPLVRVAAARAAADLGPLALDSLPSLGELLADSNPVVRESAVHALAALAPAVDDSNVSSLVHTASTAGPEAPRVGAIHALGALGARAHAATDALTALSKDRDGDVRRAASEALGKVVTATTRAARAG
ncbi:MAG: HEAT repeat domain-containing protein [bacterium]